jgi:hypothetical protein
MNIFVDGKSPFLLVPVLRITHEARHKPLITELLFLDDRSVCSSMYGVARPKGKGSNPLVDLLFDAFV